MHWKARSRYLRQTMLSRPPSFNSYLFHDNLGNLVPECVEAFLNSTVATYARGGSGANRISKTCKALVRSSPPEHRQVFYRPDPFLPVAEMIWWSLKVVNNDVELNLTSATESLNISGFSCLTDTSKPRAGWCPVTTHLPCRSYCKTHICFQLLVGFHQCIWQTASRRLPMPRAPLKYGLYPADQPTID